MDRRRFAKLVAAVVVGVWVADEVLPAQPESLLLLEDARTNEWDVSPEFDNAKWPASPITDELLADAGGYLVHEDFAEAIVLWNNADRSRANTYAVDRLAKGWYHLAVRHA